MKKISNIIILLAGLISSCVNLNLSAQSKKALCDELLKNAYIFEGKVISVKDFKIKADCNYYKYYHSYLMEVKKVVKGAISKGNVDVLVPIIHSDDGHITVPNEGIYFCYSEAPVKDSTVSNTNLKSLEYDCASSMTNGELKKGHDNIIHYFPTISDFYSYIRDNYGVIIQDK
jgi:hypothetical protein